jgi:hypothetical protein
LKYLFPTAAHRIGFGHILTEDHSTTK